MAVRAKFTCEKIEITHNGAEEIRGFKLRAVGGDTPENKEFFRWSPSGTLELQCVNPNVWPQFEVGRNYYLDFTPAE